MSISDTAVESSAVSAPAVADAEIGDAEIDDEGMTQLRISLARISRQLARQVPGEGLTQTQFSVLGTVARVSSLSLGDLAEAEGLNPTMLSRVVGKLETAGLIRRFSDPADQRVAHVEITAAGSDFHQRVKGARTTLFASHVAALEPDLQQQLAGAVPALVALAEHLQNHAIANR